MHEWGKIAMFAGISLAAAGCPKGRTNFNQGRKAQDLQDYDAAFEHYQQALKTDPGNAEYKIKFDRARFGAGELHTKNGLKLREKGDLENAASEFRKAAFMDPSSVAAEQELRKTTEMIEDRKRAANAASEPPPDNVENSYIESFNGRLRDECLNVEVFLDLADARRKLDKWRNDYNQQRPHSALADRTPEEFASVAMQLSFALSAAERAKDLTQEAVCVERFK
jgi:tetratricopeptide (TPR) repeat protein